MKNTKNVLAFISLVIACFLTVLDGTIVNVSLPSMVKYFNTDITGISWVSTAYLITFSALLINFSRIADIFGRKKLFIIGLFVFGLSSVLCGLSMSLEALVIFRVAQGIGAAILTPLAIPLAIELFGKQAMSKLAIIIGMTISVAAASGPVLGGILNETYGFRAVFFVNIPFIIISMIFGALYVRECYDKTAEKRVDVLGSILLAVGLGSVTFSLVKGNDYGWNSPTIITLLGIALLAFILFVVIQKRSKSPMIDVNLFKVKSYTSSIATIAIVFFAYMPVSYLMNFYLENNLGYSVLKAGLTLGIVSGVSFLVSPLFSLLLKKTSARLISFIAITFIAAGNLTIVFMNSTNNMNIIYTAFILLGLGVGSTTPMYQSAFEEISKDKNGMASGLLNSLRQLTACIAIALIATTSSHFYSVAIQEAKFKIQEVVQHNNVLEVNVKSKLIEAMNKSSKSNNKAFSEKSIHTMMMAEEKKVLASVPTKLQPAIKEKFQVQEKEIVLISKQANSIIDDKSIGVYNKCFLITGLLALIGFIFVPFNVRKREEYGKTSAPEFS